MTHILFCRFFQRISRINLEEPESGEITKWLNSKIRHIGQSTGNHNLPEDLQALKEILPEICEFIRQTVDIEMTAGKGFILCFMHY